MGLIDNAESKQIAWNVLHVEKRLYHDEVDVVIQREGLLLLLDNLDTHVRQESMDLLLPLLQEVRLVKENARPLLQPRNEGEADGGLAASRHETQETRLGRLFGWRVARGQLLQNRVVWKDLRGTQGASESTSLFVQRKVSSQ